MNGSENRALPRAISPSAAPNTSSVRPKAQTQARRVLAPCPAGARSPGFEGARGLAKEVKAQAFDILAVMGADRRVCDALQGGAQGLVQGGLAFGAVKDPAFGFAPPQEVDHRLGVIQHLLHGGGALGFDQIIGVLPARHFVVVLKDIFIDWQCRMHRLTCR